MLTVLAPYELILLGISGVAVVVSPLLLTWLFFSGARRNGRRRQPDFQKQVLAAADLSVEGFDVDVDLEEREIIMHPKPPLEGYFSAKPGRTPEGIGPTFGEHFYVWLEEVDDKVVENLRSAPERIAPLYDFMIGWRREVEIVELTSNEARLRPPPPLGRPLPFEMLSALVSDAAKGVGAFYAAARSPATPTGGPDIRFSRAWLTLSGLVEKRLLALSVALALALGAAALIMTDLQAVTSARVAMVWPSVAGTMVTSRVALSTGRRDKSLNKRRRKFYRAILEYEYTVQGKTYRGERFSFLWPYVNGEEDARKVTSEYKVGKAVQVYYDPNNPAESVLRRDDGAWSLSEQFQETLWYLPSVLALLLFFKLHSLAKNARRRLAGERSP